MLTLQHCNKYFTPLGRILLGAFFIAAGLSKIADVNGTTAYIESVGLPAGMVLTIAAIIFEIGAAALALAVFTFLVSFPFHGPTLWADNPTQQLMFMKNMAIVGGLLFMAAHVGSPCCRPSDSDAHSSPRPTL